MKDIETLPDIELVRADESDAEEIFKMQKKAFSGLLEKYRDFETNPASEPPENVVKRLRQNFTYYYLIRLKGKNIGAVRVVDKKINSETKRISPLFILPEYRNKGYAQAAILQVEKLHGVSGWELATIAQETKNCYLYEKMGYAKTDKTINVNTSMTLVFYKK